jgi:hypothetical protein
MTAHLQHLMAVSRLFGVTALVFMLVMGAIVLLKLNG